MQWTRTWVAIAGVALVVAGGGLGLLFAKASTRTYSATSPDNLVVPGELGGGVALCSPGDRVVGGGYAIHAKQGVTYNWSDVAPLRLLSSQPFEELPGGPAPAGTRGWQVEWWWTDTSIPAFVVDIWAVCQT